jgi:hypothetical protein
MGLRQSIDETAEPPAGARTHLRTSAEVQPIRLNMWFRRAASVRCPCLFVLIGFLPSLLPASSGKAPLTVNESATKVLLEDQQVQALVAVVNDSGLSQWVHVRVQLLDPIISRRPSDALLSLEKSSETRARHPNPSDTRGKKKRIKKRLGTTGEKKIVYWRGRCL